MLECVINVSEGRRLDAVEAIAAAAGEALWDVHSDPHHNRSVLTLGGPRVEKAARAVAKAAVERLDLRHHEGVHPRIGVVDVVPFVPLAPNALGDAIEAREGFAEWMGSRLGVPCFLYGFGTDRTLPEIRAGAFRSLRPDRGPRKPHAAAGACAVGAREVLVAYNVWLRSGDAAAAARAVRQPGIVRTLALDVGGQAQVSCNLLEPDRVGPAEVYDQVASMAEVDRAELVGLVPRSVLAAVPESRWAELDLAESKTIESHL